VRHRRNFVLALALLLALPLLACDPRVLNAWGDLLESAQIIWSLTWTAPPDYEAIGVLCSEDLLAAHGEPPVAYVDQIIHTTEEIAAAWGVGMPYSSTFTLGAPYAKPDGSGRIMVPLRFTYAYSDAYGIPAGGPITGLCLEFEEVDDGGTPVPLLADGFQVGDWVLPTTTPQLGYAECSSGITPTPTPTPTPLPTDTPTPTPIPEGDAWEDDDPPNHSSIAVGESQSRSLDPYGDQEVVHLWVWSGLHVAVSTHGLGGLASTNLEVPTCSLASTNLEVPTCSGTFSDTDGGQASVDWTSQCDEVVVMSIWSENGYYGPGETYTLSVQNLGAAR